MANQGLSTEDITRPLDPDDIRRMTTKMTAEFAQTGSHFRLITGDAGYVTAAAGAKVAIMNRWKIERSGAMPDGKPRYRLRASFSFVNEALMGLVGHGKIRGRPVLQMRTKLGVENVDIDAWSEWRYEDGLLVLEDIQHFDAKPARTVSTAR
jgi:hypothetical protein